MQINNNLKQHYKNIYESNSDSLQKWRQISAIDKVKNIISVCSCSEYEKILEIGSGDGAVLHELSKRQFSKEFHALEISKDAISIIKQRNINNLKKITLFNGYDIPYPDSFFDLVILSHVLEHVEYPRKLLIEAKRIAKYIYIEVPLEDTIRLPKNFRLNSSGHINFFNPRTIRYLIQSMNLFLISQIIKGHSFEVYKYKSGNMAIFKYILKETLLKLFPKIAVLLFTYHSAILCKLKQK